MKLNPDCIRDILLTIEDTTDLEHWLAYPEESSQCPFLESYDTQVVKYHMHQCLLSNLIIADISDLSYSFLVKDLTPQGHAFLADIRSDTTWNKVKQAGKSMGLYSLDSLLKIAAGVASNLVSAYFKGMMQ